VKDSIKPHIVLGDCLNALKKVEENSVDLIVTSPPYADRRAKTYGGVKPEEYVAWFLPRSKEFLRVLKPDGTFILNIKEKVENGERHTFVIDLILALRQQGWLWTEEFIWHKKNSYPGKWPNRFRDSWERLLQFNKTRHFVVCSALSPKKRQGHSDPLNVGYMSITTYYQHNCGWGMRLRRDS
jgi:site-specific DNA-methyltransferase (adenine-specific)